MLNTKHILALGFTLLELLMALTVVGILFTLTYPQYQSYILKARRNEGKAALMHLSIKMEEYYSAYKTYTGATLARVGINSTTTSQGNYALSISSANTDSFTILATPQGNQAINDTECAKLSLNQDGLKQISGTGSASECWGY
jgi:type IV pilus assembly protein PilE